MNTFLRQCVQIFRLLIRALCRLLFDAKILLKKQFNKNIYTRILFTNITAFFAGLIAVTMFSSYVVKQVTYEQVEQDLLRKAKRVNFALLQRGYETWSGKADEEENKEDRSRQDLLKFLADAFDARITIFNRDGNIVGTSAEQEVVLGSKVEAVFIEKIAKGETKITRMVDKETDQLTLSAVVPFGNNKDLIENGILLEAEPSNLELSLHKMRLFLLIGGMVILVIFIFISVYLAMYISRPITRLATTVLEISRGSDVLSVENQPLDEINSLAGHLSKLAARLQKIQAKSRRMEEERSQLFGEISHELRTPLTSVQGFVEAIRDGVVQDKALMERYLDTIYTQTLHISRLVDDLLALSRLESGNITVEKLPVNLAALTQGVVMSMEAAAISKNTSILFEKKTENLMVLGDVDRMEQIIRNLLKNAIRATENGTIRVNVETRQREAVLIIEDDGIGIAPEDLAHIWERFYRVKNQRSSNIQEKGSGLGLVIVKKLVQLQGGTIDVASQLGKGTVFTIRFPCFEQK